MSRWRYACPECESRAVHQLVSGRRPPGARYSADGSGRQQAAADAGAEYACDACGARLSAVIDVKSGCRVQPSRL